MNPRVSVIVPTYNNRALTIERIPVLHSYLSDNFESFEIILVEDGSKREERVASEDLPGETKLLTSETNRGKGFAVKRGMLAAQGSVRVFTDIDLPYDLSFIPCACSLIESGYFHFVAGDRTHKDSLSELPRSLIRQAISRMLEKIVYLAIIGGVLDTQCGLKAFSGDLAGSLFPKIRTDRFGFDVEIFYLLSKYNIHIKRVPVKLRYQGQSSVSPLADGMRTALELLHIPLRWYLGAYNSLELRQFESFRYWEIPKKRPP